MLLYLQVLEANIKVEEWLEKQQESEIANLPSPDQLVQLVISRTLYHVQAKPNKVTVGNSFTVFESGAVGFSCSEKPSLSVMYPGTNVPLVNLSDRKVYSSATSVKISGVEYLAASCKEDGRVYLWNIERNTSKKVFDPKLARERYNHMIMCKINESTIGYGEVGPDTDGTRKVFILRTNTTEEWTLSGTLNLVVPGYVYDMCYKEVEGAQCLLLCIPHDNRIMAVEMIGGKTRWEVGKEQMEEEFKPWSICTDDYGILYVTDFRQNKIHRFLSDDGSVLRSIDLRHNGIINPITARISDEYLYVEHYKNLEYTYVISILKLGHLR